MPEIEKMEKWMTCRVSARTHAAVMKLAKKAGMRPSALVRQLIEGYVHERAPQRNPT